jgi:CheY-like chemotaxis protein
MDHMMPEMDGMEAVRIIRNEIDGDYARNVPIIALTANALIGNDKLFLENGCQDFLTKPIDRTKLDAMLSKWVRDKDKEDSPEWAAPIRKIQQENEDETEQPVSSAEAAGTSAPGAAGVTAAAAGGPSIEGVDFKEGVKRMGNREAAYIRVLTSFSANMPALLTKIRDFRVDMLQDYTITIHGIKGSSYGICANEIGRQAEALEMAARNGDIEIIMEKNDGFILQMEKLIAEISKYVTSL